MPGPDLAAASDTAKDCLIRGLQAHVSFLQMPGQKHGNLRFGELESALRSQRRELDEAQAALRAERARCRALERALEAKSQLCEDLAGSRPWETSSPRLRRTASKPPPLAMAQASHQCGKEDGLCDASTCAPDSEGSGTARSATDSQVIEAFIAELRVEPPTGKADSTRPENKGRAALQRQRARCQQLNDQLQGLAQDLGPSGDTGLERHAHGPRPCQPFGHLPTQAKGALLRRLPVKLYRPAMKSSRQWSSKPDIMKHILTFPGFGPFMASAYWQLLRLRFPTAATAPPATGRVLLSNVKPLGRSKLTQASKGPKEAPGEGAAVEAYWPDDDMWLDAQVTQVFEDGTYRIVWSMDDSESDVPADYVRWPGDMGEEEGRSTGSSGAFCWYPECYSSSQNEQCTRFDVAAAVWRHVQAQSLAAAEAVTEAAEPKTAAKAKANKKAEKRKHRHKRRTAKAKEQSRPEGNVFCLQG
eukprot:s1463_g4.t1